MYIYVSSQCIVLQNELRYLSIDYALRLGINLRLQFTVLYHFISKYVTQIFLQVKLAEVARGLRVKEREIDSSWPHLVHVTGLLTTTKATIRNILSSLPSSGKVYRFN